MISFPTIENRKELLYRHPFLASGIILLLLMTGMLYQLSSLPFFEPDESRYVEVSREMLETGEYMIPQLNYEIRLNKPALYHWMLALDFHWMGISYFSARILSIFAGICILILTGTYAARYLGTDAKIPLSITILGTSALFWWMSRIAMVDIFLCFCICSATFLFFDWERNREKKQILWAVAFLIALGVNLKGPVALVLPVMTFWIYVVLVGEGKAIWKAAPWFRFLGMIFLLSIPWYLIVTLKLGNSAGQYFFFDELIARFFTDKFHRSRPIYNFLLTVPLILIPWPFLVFRAFWSQRIYIRSQGLRYWIQTNRFHGYLFIWTLSTLLFFSLCKSKMIHYLLPALPPVALLTADWLDLWTRRRSRILSIWISLGLIVFVTLSAAVWLFYAFDPEKSGIPLLILSTIGMVCYLFYLSIFRFSGHFSHLAGFILLPVFFYHLAIMGLARDRDIWPTEEEFAQFVKQWCMPTTEIYANYSIKPSLLTAMSRPVAKLVDLKQTSWIFESPTPSLLLIKKSVMEGFLQSMTGKEEIQSLIRHYVPFENYALVYNRAYADLYLNSPPDLVLEPKGDIRLVAVGNSGEKSRNSYQIGKALAALHPQPDAVILLGDNIFLHPSRKYSHIDSTFEFPFQALLQKQIPFFAVLGNLDRPIASWMTRYPPFNMNGRRYYSKSFGNGLVDCFILDGHSWNQFGFWEDSEQSKWLSDNLERSKSKWKLVAIHQPVYLNGQGSDDFNAMQKTLVPILEEFRIPVVLSGHGLSYSREEDNQSIHQFLVGLGENRNLRNRNVLNIDMDESQESVFLVLDITKKEIRASAISSTGNLIDQDRIQILSQNQQSARVMR